MPQIIEKFYWDTPGDLIVLTHGGAYPQVPIPAGIESFQGTELESQIVVAMKLRDADNNVIGVGSELEFVDERGNLQVFFTFVIPSRGTIFVHAVKGVAPELAEIFGNVAQTGESWTGDLPIVSTIGPGTDGRGVIVGGTGEFAGATGSQQQTIQFATINPDGPIARQEELLTIELP